MKRMLSFIMAVLMMILVVGCGGSSNEPVKEPSNVSGQANQENQSEENTEPAPDNNTPAAPSEAEIEETVLVDEAGVKITAKSLDLKGWLGPEIKLLIENESDKGLTVQARNSSVNGYMIESLMSVDVAAGKKANDSLTFSSSDLELCGIESIADMEFSFHIFDSESWDDYLNTEMISLKTSIADSYNYSFDDTGDVAYEGNGVKIVIKGLDTDDSFFGPGLVVYVENTSGKDVTVQVRDVSVNGYMMDPIFSAEVCSEKHAVSSVTFMESELEENDIEEITDIEVSFHIFDSESWDTIVDTDAVTITF